MVESVIVLGSLLQTKTIVQYATTANNNNHTAATKDDPDRNVIAPAHTTTLSVVDVQFETHAALHQEQP